MTCSNCIALQSQLAEARAEVERLKQEWDRFHHLMQKHGLHPGRTDDDLLVLLDVNLSASKEGLHHLRANNVELRAEVERLRPVWHAAKALAELGPMSFAELDRRLSNLRAAIDAARSQP